MKILKNSRVILNIFSMSDILNLSCLYLVLIIGLYNTIALSSSFAFFGEQNIRKENEQVLIVSNV